MCINRARYSCAQRWVPRAAANKTFCEKKLNSEAQTEKHEVAFGDADAELMSLTTVCPTDWQRFWRGSFPAPPHR